jgi:hypothetical protein
MCSAALLSMRLPCLSRQAKSPSITRPDGNTTWKQVQHTAHILDAGVHCLEALSVLTCG